MNFKLLAIERRRINTDGEGICDLIALAGCPLRCKYCLNKKVLANMRVKEFSKEALLQNILQEMCYFIATGGGITFGGGESLLQYEAIKEFCEMKPAWLNVNIETSLNYTEESVKTLIPYINEWIVDIKTLDHDIYKKYTGKSDRRMRKNLKILAGEVPQKCKIRIPFIPNYKENKELLEKEEDTIRNLGFTRINVFNYVIR